MPGHLHGFNMSTKIELVSNALVRLGESPISSLSEGGASGIVGNSLYEPTLLAMLSANRWRFASKKRQLARLSTPPQNEYRYAFQLPADMLLLYRVIPRINYERYEDTLLTDVLELSVDYAFRPDESRFPAYFNLALEYALAAEFALSVTSNKGLHELFALRAQKQMATAMYADAQERPATAVQSFDYIDIRG